MSPRPLLPLWLALLGLAPGLAAQLPVRAPGGTLSGTVRDSITGLPVGYALLSLDDRQPRVFANEAGRFALSGLGAGRVTLRVQQIGYRQVQLALLVDASPGPVTASSSITITLVRQAYVLPTLTVEGDVCSGAAETQGGGASIVDEAFVNAERLLSIQEDYPYRGTAERANRILDHQYQVMQEWVDTLRYDSRSTIQYHRGRVLENVRVGNARKEIANYFTTVDIAREEFRRNHCFWYAGRDSVSGFPAYRIRFAPIKGLRTPDWTGSLLIDSASLRLLSSEARLVNLPRSGTGFASASCSMLYKEIAPTLVQEFYAHCAIRRNSLPPSFIDLRWQLIEHRFLGRRPDSAGVVP